MAVMGIDANIFYALVVGTFIGVILIAVFSITVLWTPALTFLKAKLMRKSIFFMWGRDGTGSFKVPNKKENEFAIFNKIGVFGISRDSYVYENKSKQPIYLADRDIGVSVKKEWPRILEQLQVFFKDLKNGKDYKFFIDRAKRYENDLLKNPKILLLGSTMRVSDLASYYPMNIKPSYIHSYGEIAKRQERRKMDNLKWLVGFAVVILCVAIGGYMLIGQVNKANTSCNCDFGSAIDKFCVGNNVSVPTGTKFDGSLVTEINPGTSSGGGKQVTEIS